MIGPATSGRTRWLSRATCFADAHAERRRSHSNDPWARRVAPFPPYACCANPPTHLPYVLVRRFRPYAPVNPEYQGSQATGRLALLPSPCQHSRRWHSDYPSARNKADARKFRPVLADHSYLNELFPQPLEQLCGLSYFRSLDLLLPMPRPGLSQTLRPHATSSRRSDRYPPSCRYPSQSRDFDSRTYLKITDSCRSAINAE